MWIPVLGGVVLSVLVLGTAHAQPVLEYAELEPHSAELTLVFQHPVDIFDLFSDGITIKDSVNSAVISPSQFLLARENRIMLDVGGGALDALNLTGSLWVVYGEKSTDESFHPQRVDVRHVIRVGLVAPPGGGHLEAMAQLAAEDLSAVLAAGDPPRAVRLHVQNDEDPVASLLHLYEAEVNAAVGTGDVLDTLKTVGGQMVVIACCSPHQGDDELALPGSFALIPDDSDALRAVLAAMAHRQVNHVIPVYVDDASGRVLHDQIRRGAYSAVGEGVVYDPDAPVDQIITGLSDLVVARISETPGSRPGILLTDPSWAPAILEAAPSAKNLRLAQWFGVSGHALNGGAGDRFAADVGYSVPAPGAPGGASAAVLADRIYDRTGSWPEPGFYSAYDAVFLAALSQLETGDAPGREADIPALREAVRTNAQNMAGISGHVGLDGLGGLASPMHHIMTVHGDSWVKTAVHNMPSYRLTGMQYVAGAPVHFYMYGIGDGTVHDAAKIGLLVDGYDAAPALLAARLGVASGGAVPLVDVVVQHSGVISDMMERFDGMGVNLVVAHAGPATIAEAAAYSGDVTILGTATPADSHDDNVFGLAPSDFSLAKAISDTLLADGMHGAVVVHQKEHSMLTDMLSAEFEGVIQPLSYEDASALSGRVISALHAAGLYGESTTAILVLGDDASALLAAAAGTSLRNYNWYVAAAPIPFDVDVAADMSVAGIAQAISDGGPAQLAQAPLTHLYGQVPARNLVVMEAGRIASESMQAAGPAAGSPDWDQVRAAIPRASSEDGIVLNDASLDDNGNLVSASYDVWTVKESVWIKDRLYMPATGLLDRVRVGIAAPVTGLLSEYGIMQVHAAHQAISFQNAHLAEDAKPWRLAASVADTAADDFRTASALQTLHNRGVNIVVGPSDGAILQNAVPLATDLNMTLLGCCSDWPASQQDSVFRMLPGHSGQVRALAAVMNLDAIRDLVVLHPDDALGTAFAQNITSALDDVGMVFYEYAAGGPPGSETISGAAEAVAERAGDRPGSVGVLVADFENTHAILAQAGQYRDLESAKWYGISRDGILPSLPSGSTAEISARNVEFTVALPAAATQSLGIINYVRESTGFEPYVGVFAAYDSATLLALTLRGMDGDTDAPLLAALLPLVAADHQGLMGDLILDDNGDLNNGLYSIRVMGSEVWQPVLIYDSAANSLRNPP